MRSLAAAALARRHMLADQRLRERHQAATAETLHGARGNQEQQSGSQSAGQRCHGKNGQRAQQHPAPSEAVAEMAIQRRRDRRRQQIGDHDPRQIGQSAQGPGDRRQCAGENRLIGRCEKHRDHDTWKNPKKCLARAQRLGRSRWREFDLFRRIRISLRRHGHSEFGDRKKARSAWARRQTYRPALHPRTVGARVSCVRKT